MKNMPIPETLCLIPARGGSKGIPRKNIKTLSGKPLIAHTIVCAKKSELIGRVVVSTDDEEIAEISKHYGAEVPFLRPPHLAEDLTPDLPVFEHALHYFKEHENYTPDLVMHLRPTGPIRRFETLDSAIRLMAEQPEAESLRAVAIPSQTPYKMWRIGKDGYLETLLSVEGLQEPYNEPRQRLPKIFWQNGYVDIVRSSVVENLRSMSGKKILPFVIEEDYIEIDYLEDFEKAEKLITSLQRKKPTTTYVNTERYPA